MTEGSLFYIQIKVLVPMTDFSDEGVDELERDIFALRDKLSEWLHKNGPEDWQIELRVPARNEVFFDD